MIFQPGGCLRSGWRILLYVTMTAFAAQFAVWVYYAVGGLGFAEPLFRGGQGNLMLLDLLLCTAALSMAYLVIRYVDLRPFGALGFSFHGRWLVDTAQGALIAALMVAAVFAGEQVSGSNQLSFAGPGLKAGVHDAALYVIAFGLAAALEEVLARGYVFQALIDGTGRVAAVAITSGLFGLGHAMNPHATPLSILNTVLAGVWLALGYLKTRSLWLPTAMHVSWNFCLGYVFGFPVSGVRVSAPLLQAQPRGPEWLTGGAYGPEGGVLCTAVMLVCAVWITHSKLIRSAPDATALWTAQGVKG